MLEIMLSQRKKKATYLKGNPADYLFFADFEAAQVGSKQLPDLSPNNIILTPYSDSGANFGVVNDPVLGKCFHFNGAGYFSDMANRLNNFSVESYDIEVGFAKEIEWGSYLMATGGWDGNIAPSGISIIVNADQTQLFAMNDTNMSFTRHYGTILRPFASKFVQLLYQKRSTGLTITNLTDNIVTTSDKPNNPKDTFFSVGGYPNGNSSHHGLMKYLAIKKVIE